MDKGFNESMPIYLQLMEDIRKSILSGERKPGDKMEPVRELAGCYGVNPNTVQRALLELEREGLLFSERTAGRYVTKDTDYIRQARMEFAHGMADNFLSEMRKMGYLEEEITELLKKKSKGVEHTWIA